MKRLLDLTVEDLVASPVWRYEGGSGAEALVVPSERKALSHLDDEIFLARTEFELFDSTRHFGFCFPADDSGMGYLQPVILTRTGPVSFWFDGPVSPDVIASQWKALGKEAREIFPVGFRCLIPVDGGTVRGRIRGVESSEEAAPKPADAEPRRIGIGTGEKRTARRRQAEMEVEFTQDSLYGTGVTSDVSRRGMFVRSTRTPGTGPTVRLTVHLPEGRKLFLTGKVVRSAGPAPGFGLRLSDDWPDFEKLFPRRRK
ncbi:MAG: PilZ domain-containing protein [Thermoanaerobaculia bacterium]